MRIRIHDLQWKKWIRIQVMKISISIFFNKRKMPKLIFFFLFAYFNILT